MQPPLVGQHGGGRRGSRLGPAQHLPLTPGRQPGPGELQPLPPPHPAHQLRHLRHAHQHQRGLIPQAGRRLCNKTDLFCGSSETIRHQPALTAGPKAAGQRDSKLGLIKLLAIKHIK